MYNFSALRMGFLRGETTDICFTMRRQSELCEAVRLQVTASRQAEASRRDGSREGMDGIREVHLVEQSQGARRTLPTTRYVVDFVR